MRTDHLIVDKDLPDRSNLDGSNACKVSLAQYDLLCISHDSWGSSLRLEWRYPWSQLSFPGHLEPQPHGSDFLRHQDMRAVGVMMVLALWAVPRFRRGYLQEAIAAKHLSEIDWRSVTLSIRGMVSMMGIELDHFWWGKLYLLYLSVVFIYFVLLCSFSHSAHTEGGNIIFPVLVECMSHWAKPESTGRTYLFRSGPPAWGCVIHNA